MSSSIDAPHFGISERVQVCECWLVPESVEVSIVLPVRNGAKTLRPALDSIIAQTFGHWELLVIDDGSRDDTAQIAGAYAGRDRRIRLATGPFVSAGVAAQAGLVAALQEGCALARAPLIARMDADDFMDPRRLELQRQFLERHADIGLVSCLVEYGGDRASQAGYAVHVDWINSLRTPEEITLRRFVESPVAHPTVMFRRPLLQQYGGYRAGDFPEDYELWLRWLDAGARFGKVDAVLLTWNDSSNRLSRVDERYAVETFYRIKCHYLARWIRRSVAQKPLWLWGAGRVTRRRFASLESEGLSLAGFIDIDRNKIGQARDARRVIGPASIPAEAFVIVGVGVRGARELITAHLQSTGRVEGRDYILAA